MYSPHGADDTSTHARKDDSQPIRINWLGFEASVESDDALFDSHLVVNDFSVNSVDAVELAEVETPRGFDELGLGRVRVGISERGDDDGRNVTRSRKHNHSVQSPERCLVRNKSSAHMNCALTPRTAEAALS